MFKRIHTKLMAPQRSIKCVCLKGGKKQFVPGNIKLINPQLEGKTKHLYFVWAFTEDNPCELQEAIQGKGGSPLYGYFTNHFDLYVMGRHDTPVLRDHFIEMKPDYMEIALFMLKEAGPLIPKGKTWSYAFCPCDHLGRKVPVGTCFSLRAKEEVDE